VLWKRQSLRLEDVFRRLPSLETERLCLLLQGGARRCQDMFENLRARSEVTEVPDVGTTPHD